MRRACLLGCVSAAVVACQSILPTPNAPSAGSDEDGEFHWPSHGPITSRFGPRGRTHHDGIDIAAREGSPVRSAAAGIVSFSGILRGYGRVVILDHSGGLRTVYAHAKEIFVEQGDRVRRGSVIAAVGRTGRASGPNLHFEIRRERVATDPLKYLPKRGPEILVGRHAPKIGG